MKILIIIFILVLFIIIFEDFFKYKKNEFDKFDELFNKKNQIKQNKIQEKPKFNYKTYHGAKYEIYIASYFKQEGYKVYMKGINEGYNDQGIDIIAYQGKEVLLIQCKNWINQVNLESIKKFVYDSRYYKQTNYKTLRYKEVRNLFVISNEYQNLEVENYINQIRNEVELYHIPIFIA